jgi:RNA polymerase sigma factor FliA
MSAASTAAVLQVDNDPNRLVVEHLYLVTHVVNQVAARYPRHVDRQELWAAGAAGLVDASRRYDPDAGVPFTRYASIRIRGAVIDSTRARDWATRSLRRQTRELNDVARDLEQQHGRAPSAAELAETIGISEDDVRSRLQAAERATLLQLDQPVADGAGGADTLESLLPEDDPTHLPADSLEQRELIGSLRVAVEHLDAPHREVVERYFFGGELLQEIAASLGVTEARVSQIRSEAVMSMRAWLATMYEGVPAVDDAAPGSRRRAGYLASMRAHTTWQQCLVAAEPAGRETVRIA